MISAGPGDAFSGLAWALAEIVAVLLGLLVLQIVVTRLVLGHRNRQRARFRERWEPILAACIDSYPSRLPRLRRREIADFIDLWNYFQESVLEHAKDRLNRVARRLGIDESAAAGLRRRSVANRLVALTALGHLREERSWSDVLEFIDSPDVAVSLCAARALVRIDPVRAAELISPRIAQRPDWPPAGIAAVLVEAGSDALSEPLAAAAEAAPADRASTLVRLLELTHPHVAGPVIGRILERTEDADTIGACLRVIQDPMYLGLVRAKLEDENWQVRVHAASALGRFGTVDDVPRLVGALSDGQWWVRYRAAQAISALPTVGLDRLRDLGETVADRYGRDMLRQIIAERELAC
jgi:HEAT repeats